MLMKIAVIVFLAEVALRRFAPRSRAYARWTAAFLAVGSVWTAVLLSVVYALAVGPTGLAMRLFGRSRGAGARPEAGPTFWVAYEANPLGAVSAARHQF
jgi:hypothetical protein